MNDILKSRRPEREAAERSIAVRFTLEVGEGFAQLKAVQDILTVHRAKLLSCMKLLSVPLAGLMKLRPRQHFAVPISLVRES